MTAGQALATELRRYLSVGPRTRRHRGRADLHTGMIDAVTHAATVPGHFNERQHAAMGPGWAAACSYSKHVRGYRVAGWKVAAVDALTPWRFAGLLGAMVDAGVSNVGEGERFLNNWPGGE